MKFTIDWCIFLYEDNNQTAQSRACSNTCAGPASAMRLAMVDRVLQTNSTIQYQYCNDGSNAFAKNVDDCVSCLQDVPSSMALVNCMFRSYTPAPSLALGIMVTGGTSSLTGPK